MVASTKSPIRFLEALGVTFTQNENPVSFFCANGGMSSNNNT
jgi:hypothetical protein